MGARKVWRGGARISKDRGEAGCIGILERIQIMPKLVDDTVQRHGRRRWRGCWGRRGVPPSEGNQSVVREGRSRQVKHLTISDRA